MWHNITNQIYEYVQLSTFDEGEDLISFFNDFVKNFQSRINELKFAQIGNFCSRQFENSIPFLSDIEESLKGIDPSGRLFLKVAIAQKKLDLGLYNDCIDILIEIEDKLRALHDVDQIVHSGLYRTMANYYKRKENHELFYQNGLQFLAYTKQSSLTDQEKKEWSV